MKDVLFWVADSDIRFLLEGFLNRPDFQRRLRTAAFTWDVKTDSNHDPGVYSKGPSLVQEFSREYQHVIFILDAEWDGSPGADRIKSDLLGDLWHHWEERREVIVIDPEVESWFWQDSPYVTQALSCNRIPNFDQQYGSARAFIRCNEPTLWPEDAPKPIRPKEARDLVLRAAHRPANPSIYKEVGSLVGIGGCVDPSFHELLLTLQTWFPPVY